MRAFSHLAVALPFLIFIAASACAAPSGVAAADEAEGGATPGHALDALIERHRMTLAMKEGRLVGAGADWLRKQADEAHFFMMGEQHATADIALFATALFRDLNARGYDHAVIEVGPWATPVLERLLRSQDSGAFERYLLEGPTPLAFPFFFYREEADFGRLVLRLSRDAGSAFWGVDQEFIAGAGPVLDRLEKWAESEPQRQALAAARAALRANPLLLGERDDPTWSLLESAFADASGESRRILDDVRMSQRIYAPFTGGGGSIYLANHERERYMKTQFHRHLSAAEAATGRTPRAFLKFGSNHVADGRSSTDVLSLGTFVQEIAWARGLETFNMTADCFGGQSRDPRSGEGRPCSGLLKASDASLRRYLFRDRWTLLDLRSLRPHKKMWKHLDDASKQLIWDFDAYLAVPEAAPATLIGR